MSERTSVVNISGDHEETIVQLARHLGTNKIRRKIFNAVYGRGGRPRSKKQIMAAAKIPLKGANAQQAQNGLDHLSKHHLIVKTENAGSVEDGSKYLYQKDPTVRANKERLIKLADNRKMANRVPTKRSPVVRGISVRHNVTNRLLRVKKRLNVLYLVANPDRENVLRVDVEVKQVQEAVRGSKFRDNITVVYRPAADLKSLIDGLNDHRPQVVHFSGHGNRQGIASDTGRMGKHSVKVLSFSLLANALAATDDRPKVVVLNSCGSSGAKQFFAICPVVLVSMSNSISDFAATAFSTVFYAAIAAGQSIKTAFNQGKVAIAAISIGEKDTPELFAPNSLNPARMILV